MLDPRAHGAPVLLRHLPEGPLVGCEVGVLRGTNAKALLDARPELLLYLVDDWSLGGIVSESPAEIRTQARRRLEPHRDRIIWREMDSCVASESFRSRTLDFVYLDSSHEAGHLLVEIDAWSRAVKPGGILAGHDYGHPDYPGVKNAVDHKALYKFRGGLHVEERTWLTKL